GARSSARAWVCRGCALILWRTPQSFSVAAVGRGAGRRARGELQLLAQAHHIAARDLVDDQARARAAPGVEDGRVVAPSELAPDRGQGFAGELAREVHR